MSELLQGENLSESEIELNRVRQQNLAKAALYEERKLFHYGEVETPSGFVSPKASYWARNKAHEDVASMFPEQHQ